jgi:hypothetical protein
MGDLGGHAEIKGDEDAGAVLDWISLIRSRICDGVVRSSAVAGSSAIRMAGSSARAASGRSAGGNRFQRLLRQPVAPGVRS